MSTSRRNSILSKCLALAGLASICLVPSASPAHAFDLFGIHLWGSDKEANADVIVDPVPYEATLSLTSSDRDLQKALEAASLLKAKQDAPPSGAVGLIQRARDDQANLIGKLYEEGYFGGTVGVSIDGRPLDAISVTETLGGGGRTVAVAITVDPGPTFTFGRIGIKGGPGPDAEAAIFDAGLNEGGPATSTIIHNASDALVLSWQRQGHPFARIANQRIIADHATNTVDVTLDVRPGPYATIGGVTVTGTERLDAAFVEQQAEVPVGTAFHPDIIERTRKNLARIDALASAIVKVGDHVDAEGRVPLLIEVSERKRRTIGVGGYTSTTDGVGGEIFWQHRNLFGAGEKLRLEAEASREITKGSYDVLDTYNGRVGFQFEKPGIYGPRVAWLVKGVALQESPDPYDRRGVEFETGFLYRMTDELTLTSTVAYDWSHIKDAFGSKDYSLLGTPLLAAYDSRDNALDATSGVYAQLLAEPTYGTDTGNLFLTADAELRLYRAIDKEGRFVLAARGRAGTVTGAGLDEIPAHRRFYAGGGGSVRGYKYLGIGPSVPGYGPTGGLSRVEGSLEARVRVTDTVGVVAFTDAGYVAETSLLGGNEDFQVAAGLGLRYFTAVGPLRLDVAVPLNPHKHDPDFAVYFGIGQSF